MSHSGRRFGRGQAGIPGIVLLIQVTGTSPARTELRVQGVLDMSGAAKLRTKLDRLIDEGRRHLVLDVSGVTFCDSSGISALIRSRAKAEQAAGDLQLVAPSPTLRKGLELTGLARMFAV